MSSRENATMQDRRMRMLEFILNQQQLNVRSRYELQERRIRLLHSVIESYQVNMRQALILLGNEQSIPAEIPLDIHAALNEIVGTPDEYSASNILRGASNHRTRSGARLYNPSSSRNANNTQTYRHGTSPGFSEEIGQGSGGRRSNAQRSGYQGGVVYTRILNPSVARDGLTAGEIVAGTETVTYDPSMNTDRCPITWEQFEPGQQLIRINRCYHVFNRTAIMEWFQSHSNCPVCRTRVVDDLTNIISPEINNTVRLDLSGNLYTGNAYTGNVYTGNAYTGNISVDNTPTGNSIINAALGNSIRQIVSDILSVDPTREDGESELTIDITNLINTYGLIESNR